MSMLSNLDLAFKQAAHNEYSSWLHSDVATQTNAGWHGWTPLHELAKHKNLIVLRHPEVGKVSDMLGDTPLHILAQELVYWKKPKSIRRAVRKLIKHPQIDTVKNNNGFTPLHFLVRCGIDMSHFLKKKYPWYDFRKHIHISPDVISKVIDTPNSVRFIREKK